MCTCLVKLMWKGTGQPKKSSHLSQQELVGIFPTRIHGNPSTKTQQIWLPRSWTASAPSGEPQKFDRGPFVTCKMVYQGSIGKSHRIVCLPVAVCKICKCRFSFLFEKYWKTILIRCSLLLCGLLCSRPNRRFMDTSVLESKIIQRNIHQILMMKYGPSSVGKGRLQQLSKLWLEKLLKLTTSSYRLLSLVVKELKNMNIVKGLA